MSKLREIMPHLDGESRAAVIAALERLCDREWTELPTVKPRARRKRATVDERIALFILAEEGDFGAMVRLGVDLLGMSPPD